jgi:hypothetical protein
LALEVLETMLTTLNIMIDHKIQIERERTVLGLV